MPERRPLREITTENANEVFKTLTLMIPKILLIYTGGTIGMVKDSRNRTALKAFDFENLLEHIPELKLLDCEY